MVAIAAASLNDNPQVNRKIDPKAIVRAEHIDNDASVESRDL